MRQGQRQQAALVVDRRRIVLGQRPRSKARSAAAPRGRRRAGPAPPAAQDRALARSCGGRPRASDRRRRDAAERRAVGARPPGSASRAGHDQLGERIAQAWSSAGSARPRPRPARPPRRTVVSDSSRNARSAGADQLLHEARRRMRSASRAGVGILQQAACVHARRSGRRDGTPPPCRG